jgi:hypothetical protein
MENRPEDQIHQRKKKKKKTKHKQKNKEKKKKNVIGFVKLLLKQSELGISKQIYVCKQFLHKENQLTWILLLLECWKQFDSTV